MVIPRPDELFGITAGSLPYDPKPARVAAAVIEFVRLGRPKFLIGGLLGGALGTAIAAYDAGHVDWAAYGLAQATITAFHAMTHYANDYYDRHGDARGARTAYSGGSGVLAAGTLAPSVALNAALSLLVAGIAGAALLALTGREAAAVIALGIAVFAWAYSAPPARLLARGAGEFDAALIVAVLVPSCAYAAQAGRPGWPQIAALLPSAAAMFAMMIGVEYPDVDADDLSGKRNLVVRAGRAAAASYGYLALAAIVAATAVALIAGAPRMLGIAIAATLPWAVAFALALRAHGWTAPHGNARIAARGVALFIAVMSATLVAYLVAPRFTP